MRTLSMEKGSKCSYSLSLQKFSYISKELKTRENEESLLFLMPAVNGLTN